MIADSDGKVIAGSNLYQAIGFDSPAQGIKRVLASSLPGTKRYQTGRRALSDSRQLHTERITYQEVL